MSYLTHKTSQNLLFWFLTSKHLILHHVSHLFPLSALIFVVDSTDSDRLEEAYDELAGLITEKQLKDAMLLVFANKQVCVFSLWPLSSSR